MWRGECNITEILDHMILDCLYYSMKRERTCLNSGVRLISKRSWQTLEYYSALRSFSCAFTEDFAEFPVI